MARYHSPGVWICPWCERALPEDEFTEDDYRRRHNKGPGRCRDCDREFGRAKSALSPSGKWADTLDHAAAADLAKPTCKAHAWGSGYYDKTAKANAQERAAAARSGDPTERTFAERRQDEDKLQAAAERIAAERHQELDRAARRRAENQAPRTGKEPAPPTNDQAAEEDKARKQALRDWRRAKRRAELRDEPIPPMPGTAEELPA